MKKVQKSPQVSAGHGGKMDRKAESVLAALLSSPTIGAAAKAAGVSEKTIRRWLKQPDFKQRYADLRRELVDDTVRVLQRGGSRASAELLRIMLDPLTPVAIKLGAASRVVELVARFHEMLDFESRLAALEQAAQSSPEKTDGELWA